MLCDQEINENECKKALLELKNNKTPGCDGLPVEFYKFFWNKVKCLILDSFHWSFKNKQLSLDQKRGIINLVPKPGKDLCQLKNWHPISLLNVDYKILTKILANRLQSCLDEIIYSDQVGYIKNRFIGENIRTTVDMMTYCKMKKVPLLITQIDFEKAFDSLSWDFMLKCLKKFNFGDSFISWVEILYNGIESCVINNGKASNFF